MKVFFVVITALLISASSFAFMQHDYELGQCNDCHNLNREEAEELLAGWGARVITVEPAEVPGLWLVLTDRETEKVPVYIDYAKKHLFVGSVYQLVNGEDLTEKRYIESNRIDISRIPLEDALLLGNPKAQAKIIVFSDPLCPSCQRLHDEMKKVVQLDPGVAFLIKMFPLDIHSDAGEIARSVVCERSLTLLESSYAGNAVSPPTCESSVVEETVVLAESLGINATPTLIMPDGRLLTGGRPANKILELLGRSIMDTNQKENARERLERKDGGK